MLPPPAGYNSSCTLMMEEARYSETLVNCMQGYTAVAYSRRQQFHSHRRQHLKFHRLSIALITDIMNVSNKILRESENKMLGRIFEQKKRRSGYLSILHNQELHNLGRHLLMSK
jgi:hypothetical protein